MASVNFCLFKQLPLYTIMIMSLRSIERVRNEKEFISMLLHTETLDWDANVDENFRSRWWRKCEVVSKGDWGRVVRLFYHIFYGEGFVIKPGNSYLREADERPFAGKHYLRNVMI